VRRRVVVLAGGRWGGRRGGGGGGGGGGGRRGGACVFQSRLWGQGLGGLSERGTQRSSVRMVALQDNPESWWALGAAVGKKNDCNGSRVARRAG